MRGMNAGTGKALGDLDHLRQSIIDILSTRKGTRVMRRRYGSDVPNLIDRPVNDELPVDIYVAVAESLAEFEPRLALREASMTRMGDGVIEFSLTGDYLPDGKTLTISGIFVR